ncbi:MAG: transcription termination/antitermination protein NusG [Eubacteriales bacterium]|jgi:transcriptional antiterminator NusG|nr:transcription termination/antitermination protein NusG [Eubacteriales bacterium]
MSDFSDSNIESRWYVAHTYSGYENKVKANIEKIVENRSLQHLIMDVKIPVEIVVEKNGIDEDGNAKVKEVENKVFPSYVLIKMVMTDESWHVIRNIRGVTGFVGPGSKPVPLSDEEILLIGIESRVISLEYNVGDSVKISSGPLSGYIGIVQEISEDKKKIMVLVSMFGRDTPVELDSDAVKLLEM